jgi:two-component system OmpR family sensor kinase
LTLRTRLLIGLVLLAAIGLSVTGVVTYHELQTYLLNRVDGQLEHAQQPALFFADFHGGQGNAEALLPPGTWAQVRAADGTVLGTNPGSLDNQGPPTLPDKLGTGEELFTVHGPHYRVLSGSLREFGVRDPTTRQVTSVPGRLIVAIPLNDVDATLHRLLFVELVVAAGVLLALAALAWWVVKLGLRPLQEMQVTAGAIAAGDLSRRVETADERTEVGRLGLALNQMLQQIEHAFDERAASEARLRRFVGDASHELRTPLTSIRGYAELFRRGAAERPEDLAKAMRRIEEEADRMGVLVDDLLLLARLDQGRPLERAPVDLTRIVGDAVDDARAVAPGRRIEYSPNGAVVVPGDEVRLRQVMANLLQNAVRHTPTDTPVHVRVTTDDDDAIIEVRDEGPGMPTDEADRAFERFWRGDASRTRASGGTGLGLAIVAAIADAHGGSASVDTAPGQGATFRVHLPKTARPQPPAEADADAEAEADSGDAARAAGPPPAPDIPIAELEEAPVQRSSDA